MKADTLLYGLYHLVIHGTAPPRLVFFTGSINDIRLKRKGQPFQMPYSSRYFAMVILNSSWAVGGV